MVMQQPDKSVFHPPAVKWQRPGPVVLPRADFIICRHCLFVNSQAYHFCTQCGIPLHDELQPQTLYTIRVRQRKELLESLEAPIQTARVTLYLLTAFCGLGILFVLNQPGEKYLLVTVLVLLALLFGIMAHWSNSKPFTALLIGFIITGMFFAMSFLGKFFSLLHSVQGVYSVAITLVILYILFKGIRAAYKASIIHAETDAV